MNYLLGLVVISMAAFASCIPHEKHRQHGHHHHHGHSEGFEGGHQGQPGYGNQGGQSFSGSGKCYHLSAKKSH